VTSLGSLPASDVRQTALRTIWHNRLIVGALNLMAGEPGAGKSSLTAMIAADMSRRGSTVIVSNSEDDPGSVTVPRLAAAGAILERVHVIPPEDAPLFPRELDALEYVIKATGTKLVVLDPIGAHFRPERLAHDRPTLRQMAKVAREAQCAILAIHHTTKIGTVGGPNSGLIGTARAVYVYGYDPDDEDRRALSCVKINGTDSPPAMILEHETVEHQFGSTVIEAGRLRRIRESNSKASRHRGKRNADRDAACFKWLSEFLAAGADCSRPSIEVRAEGRSAGFGWATLQRAKVTLEVEHRRTAGFGADGHWLWRLPDEHPLRDAGPSA
jgi:putative DNA primase/helicase